MSDNKNNDLQGVKEIPVAGHLLGFFISIAIALVLGSYINVFIANFAQVIFMINTAFIVVMSKFLSYANIAILQGLFISVISLFAFNRFFR